MKFGVAMTDGDDRPLYVKQKNPCGGTGTRLNGLEPCSLNNFYDKQAYQSKVNIKQTTSLTRSVANEGQEVQLTNEIDISR